MKALSPQELLSRWEQFQKSYENNLKQREFCEAARANGIHLNKDNFHEYVVMGILIFHRKEHKMVSINTSCLTLGYMDAVTKRLAAAYKARLKVVVKEEETPKESEEAPAPKKRCAGIVTTFSKSAAKQHRLNTAKVDICGNRLDVSYVVRKLDAAGFVVLPKPGKGEYYEKVPKALWQMLKEHFKK